MISPSVKSTPEKCNPPSKFLIPLLFILNVVLIYPVFFPNLSEIGPWDESFYINSGRLLIEGEAGSRLPQYASNPLEAFLYSITYLPVRNTDFWLVHSCTIGRFILFGFLWLSAYLVAKQLSYLSHPFIMVVLLLATPALKYLLRNPSDAQCTALSAFALWQVLSWYHHKKIKHLWLASLFLGFAALSRSDGLILFFIFIVIAVLISVSMKRIGAALVASIIPFVMMVGGYVLIYGLITGQFELGIAKRTYTAFEQGQGFAYEYSQTKGEADVRRMYGTPQENRYSVLSAIRRNPEAFFDRVRQTIKTSPKRMYIAYGERAGIIVLLLAAMGTVEIVRKRLYLLFCILLLWSVHILVYLATFYRPSYFLLPYFVIFSFASVGVHSILYATQERRFYFLTILLLGLAVLGADSHWPNLFSAALIFLIVLWTMKIVLKRYQYSDAIVPVIMIAAVCSLLILEENYPRPQFRTIDTSPYEKASLFMKEHLEPNARVFGWFPRDVWNAKMSFGLLDFPLYKTDEKALAQAIVYLHMKALYIDETFLRDSPERWAIIQKLIGKDLEVGFRSENGEVQVLLVRKNSVQQSAISQQPGN